jgi:hypothetical protein
MVGGMVEVGTAIDAGTDPASFKHISIRGLQA